MVRLIPGEEGRERGDGEMDAGERYEVGLELVQVDVQGAVEAEGRGDGGDDLGDKAVQVRETGLRDVELGLANVKNRLVVDLIIKDLHN